MSKIMRAKLEEICQNWYDRNIDCTYGEPKDNNELCAKDALEKEHEDYEKFLEENDLSEEGFTFDEFLQSA